MPAVVPAVNVAVQLAVPTGCVPCASVQGDVVPNEPVAVPDTVNATVPAGVEMVPVAASTTVAVQVEVPPVFTVAGLHETVVVVGRRFTVSAALLLPGPAALVAVTVTVNVPDLV